MNMISERRGLDNSRLADKDMIPDLERVEGVHAAVQPARRAQDCALGDVAVAADGDGDAGSAGWLRGVIWVCRGGCGGLSE